MNEKQPFDSPSQWSEPIQSSRDENSLQRNRTFLLSVSVPMIHIEASSGQFNGLIKHVSSNPPILTSPLVSPTSSPVFQTFPLGAERPKIKVQITIHYRDEKSFKEMVISEENKGSKVYERLNIYRRATVMNSFGGSKPYVELLVEYPDQASLLGNESVTTKSSNLPVVVGNLSRVFFNEFNIESTNGSVDVESLNCNSNVSISSTNGSVTSSGLVRAPRIRVSSVNSAINLSRLSSPESINLKSVNGSIKVNSALKCNSLNVENINGPVSLDFVTASSRFKIHTHKNISLKSAKSNSIDFHTHEGRIEGLFELNGEMKLRSSSGSIEAKIQMEKPIKDSVNVVVTSSSGKINVEYLDHSSAITLRSSIKSEMGPIKLRHQEGFHGEVDLESKIGKVEIQDEDKLEEKEVKTLGSNGKRVTGKVLIKGGEEDGKGKAGKSVASSSSNVNVSFF